MNSPLISVIVPIYNAENCLERSIESLTNQTYGNIEIILVNDGSKDNSLKLCNELANKDTRINIIDKPNGGVSSARNYGLDNAKGKYTAFLDADDYACPTMIEHMYNVMSDNNADIVHMDFIKQHSSNADFTVKHQLGTVSSLTKDEAVKWILTNKDGHGTAVWTSLFKTEIIKNIRFPEGMVIAEDKFFMFLAFLESKKVVFDSGKEYIYLVWDSSSIHSTYTKKNTSSILLAQKTLQTVNEKYTQYKEYAIVNLYKVYLANMRGFFELENGDNEMRQLACDMKKLLKSKTPAYFAQYASKKEVLELKLVKLGLPFYKAYIKSKGFAAKLLKR